MNIVWMLDDFEACNGATRVIPRSHRLRIDTPRGIRTYEEWLAKPAFRKRPEDPIPVEAPAGTALILDGRVWHQDGANSTSYRRRHAVHTYYCRPHIRPQTVFPLSVPPEVLAEVGRSHLLRRLLGFETYYEVIGVIDRQAALVETSEGGSWVPQPGGEVIELRRPKTRR